MPDFSNITVVGIHGNGGIGSMIPAVKKTAAGLPGCRTLLLGDTAVETDITQKRTGSFDYVGYSHFVIYCLYQFIETDYVLIVQDDGWALNPANWRNEWFDYDYIGGITHAALCGTDFKTNYLWVGYPNPAIVQNGGFSLRSRALLEAPSKYDITMKSVPHVMLTNEDVQLCCFMRPTLERKGLKFAPYEEALIFAVEHLAPGVHDDLDLHTVYGHHGKFRRLVGDTEVLWSMPIEEVQTTYGERRIVDLFHHYGYTLRSPETRPC